MNPTRLAADDADGAWFPRLHTQVETAGGVPFVTISAADHDFGAMMIKRLMDVVGALVGLVLSVPIIAVTAIPLKLESPGPLFFKQKRVGRNGRPFLYLQLRSMYTDAEQRKQELMAQNKMQGLMFKMDDDPRVTKVGKFIRRTSIDELPQFWNVLRGDMSLVGTRPPTVDEYEQYDSHHKRRLSMKPGITGLWQVSGRSDIQDFEEVVKLDVTYIDHWSPRARPAHPRQDRRRRPAAAPAQSEKKARGVFFSLPYKTIQKRPPPGSSGSGRFCIINCF